MCGILVVFSSCPLTLALEKLHHRMVLYVIESRPALAM
jgi:hypothetical protein